MLLWKAIEKMRALTAAGEYFSFSFMSYNASKLKSEGVVEVAKAQLRKKRAGSGGTLADALLVYYDYDKHECRQCYIPLIMTFNGQKISIHNDKE